MTLLALLFGAVLALPFWMLRWAQAWRLAVIYLLAGLTARMLATPVGGPELDYGYLVIVVLGRIALAALVAGFLGRVVWQLWKRPRAGWVPRWLDPALVAWGAGLATAVGFVAISWYTVDGKAVAVHLAILALALVPVVIAFLVPFRVVRAGLLSICATLIALTLFSAVVYPRLVLASAARLAPDDHCISLPIRHRPALQPGDLTFLTMDKTPFWTGQPHTALVTEDGAVAYWSFHLTRFNPQPVLQPVVYCMPEGRSGLAEAADVGAATIEVRDVAFRVPLAYHPFKGGPDTLAISVEPPKMTPNEDALVASAWYGVGRADTVANLVPVNAAFESSEHGLEQLAAAPNQEVYVARDGGAVASQIECWDVTCLHRFSPNGTDRIILDYHRDLLPQWRDMEDRAAALFARFQR